MVCFLVLLHFKNEKVFINILEYANEIIYISDHRKKGMCLSFKLVPYLMLYDKKQFRYG